MCIYIYILFDSNHKQVFGHLHTPEGRLPQTTRQSLVLAVQAHFMIYIYI